MSDQRLADPDEEFFEALAGRKPGHLGADALRVALLDEARVVEEASAATPVQPTQAQRDLRDGIKARMLAEGIITDTTARAEPAEQAAQTARPSTQDVASMPKGARVREEPSVLSRFGAWLSTWSMPQVAGLAASMVLGVLVVLNLSGTDEDSGGGDVMRGGSGLSVSVEDPGTFAAQLVERVNALGGEATLVQINDKQWALSVTVTKQELVAPIRSFLREKGLPVPDLPPYELTVLAK